MSALAPWLSLTEDPMFFWGLVVTQCVSMGVFALVATPLTWLALADPPALAKYRIQPPNARARRDLPGAIALWLANNLLMFFVAWLLWPWLGPWAFRLGELPSAVEVVLEVAAFMVLDDFVFYWMHRGLHTSKWLYKKVHSRHHRVVAPTAIAAHTMHPVEFLLIGALTLIWPLLFDAHVLTLWLWVSLRQLEAADGHAGYVLPYNPLHLIPGYKGAGYHDFHHAKFLGNYAGFLSYLDRYFGGYSVGYLEWERRRRRD